MERCQQCFSIKELKREDACADGACSMFSCCTKKVCKDGCNFRCSYCLQKNKEMFIVEDFLQNIPKGRRIKYNIIEKTLFHTKVESLACVDCKGSRPAKSAIIWWGLSIEEWRKLYD